MRKRLFLNGFLALVVIGAALGTYFTVRSTSSSASTTQTLATAKRERGALERHFDRQRRGADRPFALVPAVGPGDCDPRVRRASTSSANQALATIDDTSERMALESAQAGLTSAQASLAGLERGETPIERQADAMSLVSAQQNITTAQQGLTDAAAKRGEQPDEVPDGNLASGASGCSGQRGGDHRASRRDPGRRARCRACRIRRIPRHPVGASADELTTRYEVDGAYCTSNKALTATSDGVVCAQVAEPAVVREERAGGAVEVEPGAESQITQAQDGVTSAKQAQTSGEMQDQQRSRTRRVSSRRRRRSTSRRWSTTP